MPTMPLATTTWVVAASRCPKNVDKPGWKPPEDHSAE
jgi:hypothetical protein